MGNTLPSCSSRGGIVKDIEKKEVDQIIKENEKKITRTGRFGRISHLPTLIEQTDQLLEEIGENEEKTEMEKSTERMEKLSSEAKQIGQEIKAKEEVPTERIQVQEPDGSLIYGMDDIKKEENREESLQILKQELKAI